MLGLGTGDSTARGWRNCSGTQCCAGVAMAGTSSCSERSVLLTVCAKNHLCPFPQLLVAHPGVARGDTVTEQLLQGPRGLSWRADVCWNRFLVENAFYLFSAEISVWGGQGVDSIMDGSGGWVGGRAPQHGGNDEPHHCGARAGEFGAAGGNLAAHPRPHPVGAVGLEAP